jgi:hypothetical protein
MLIFAAKCSKLRQGFQTLPPLHQQGSNVPNERHTARDKVKTVKDTLLHKK